MKFILGFEKTALDTGTVKTVAGILGGSVTGATLGSYLARKRKKKFGRHPHQDTAIRIGSSIAGALTARELAGRLAGKLHKLAAKQSVKKKMEDMPPKANDVPPMGEYKEPKPASQWNASEAE